METLVRNGLTKTYSDAKFFEIKIKKSLAISILSPIIVFITLLCWIEYSKFLIILRSLT